MKLEIALVIVLIILIVLAVALVPADWIPQPAPVFRGGY